MSAPALSTPLAPNPVAAPILLTMTQVTRIHGSGPAAVTALDHVSLHVRAGELVAVMGASGSGKSTLLNLAGGLDTPTDGEVALGEHLLSAMKPAERAKMRRRHVGYVFQDLNLIPALTAIENVSLPRELDGVAKGKARREAHRVLDEVGVPELANRFPDEMSGGQQQRVAIARALVGSRRLVLADEPTGALDSRTGEDVMRVLRGRVDAGAAGLLVTHEPRFAAWADRTIFLRDGRIVDALAGETFQAPVFGPEPGSAGPPRQATVAQPPMPNAANPPYQPGAAFPTATPPSGIRRQTPPVGTNWPVEP